jgi:hypothetical protein
VVIGSRGDKGANQVSGALIFYRNVCFGGGMRE